MSEGMLGAAPEELRELARTMSLSGRELDNTATSLQSAVTRVQWTGFDADSFRNRWASVLRPTLRTAGASLENIANILVAQAQEQETASSDTGFAGGSGSGGTGGTPGNTGGGTGGGTPGSSGSGTPGDDQDWSDAFTDPNYEHAPGGLEFVLNEALGDGAETVDGSVNAFMWVADKFDWTMGFADLETYMPNLHTGMQIGGRVLGGLGVVVGGLDIASGIANEDPFRVADGSVSAALSVAALAATATGVGAPVGIAIGAVSLVWGLASMISGDVPLTKRIWDGGAAVVGGVQDAVSAIGDGLGWLGGKLGFG